MNYEKNKSFIYLTTKSELTIVPRVHIILTVMYERFFFVNRNDKHNKNIVLS